ncbi:MAG: ribosome-associated translation inhibitor RaiA [Pseudomonadales bacterium]|nr:ribosome-associated translation inhibitor RaiA [Pseudomonadales bacterium]
MQLDITGHQIDLTKALQQHVRDKMRKLERHSDEITHMHVVLNVEKHSHQAEATAHVPGAELFANADADDMYAAIDLLADKIDRQLLKHKEKNVARQNGSHHRASRYDE